MQLFEICDEKLRARCSFKSQNSSKGESKIRAMVLIKCVFLSLNAATFIFKGPGKRGHIVADAFLPTQMFPRLPARATFFADTYFVSGTQNMFLILFRNILCPRQMFCAAQETSWATMCPQQCVLVYQGLKSSLHSERFRGVEEQRKTKERKRNGILPARN